jgi:antitoxin component YwqK of YwqJK toxin-antitoxin module
MRWILIFFVLSYINGHGQLKDYNIGIKGDTLNATDLKNQKQGKWVVRYDEMRGEPGYEEEGEYKNGRREGVWRRYSLLGDLIAVENFKWGYKDGLSQYFNGLGELLREESWKALNPDKLYDTLDIEDVDNLNHYKSVIVKNEGAGVKHGPWKYYDPTSGFISKTENYVLGKLENGKKPSDATTAKAGPESKTKSKPKEVLDFEKKNSGKKKIRVRDGSTGF